ncbi:hypothetical protein BT96DRAFT_990287 [Gymnopus androsaceus JB14]|uniref:Protein kinase domain-containing protein n=1 Tax=Gymnopus androsaceus JB14 TaxID=1447944 RepID=A0A6A4HY02_9AGAR|nr:hypothetical protein BT96DRAFT_990287 [Gymnopus androsaceus JB14]
MLELTKLSPGVTLRMRLRHTLTVTFTKGEDHLNGGIPSKFSFKRRFEQKKHPGLSLASTGRNLSTRSFSTAFHWCSAGVLLDLLGSPAPSYLSVDVEDFDFDLSLAERERFVQSFIQRVHLLEVQGRLSYGEVLRVEDMFNGTSSGFMKVLKTVNRILAALQDCYPGLFVAPEDADYKKSAAVQELIESERIHVEFLRMVVDHAAFLSCESKALETALESIVLNNQRLRQYHDRVLVSLQHAESTSSSIENWEAIFAFDEHPIRNNMASTYRSLCTSYLSLYDYIDQIMGTLEPVLAAHAQMLLDILCYVPTRIAEYCKELQVTIPPLSYVPASQLLYLENPIAHPPNLSQTTSLTILKMTDISTGIDEMSRELRTSRAVKILKGRAFQWRSPDSSHSIDPSELGTLVLDDQLMLEDTEVTTGPVEYQIFLFEAMLLCCLDGPRSRNQDRIQNEDMGPAKYPTRAWELGPALRRGMPLNLVYAIPTKEIREMRVLDFDSFELEWSRDSGQGQGSRRARFTMTLSFRCASGADQHDQWCSVLASFVPLVVDERYTMQTPHFSFEQLKMRRALSYQEIYQKNRRKTSQAQIFAKFKFSLSSSGGRRHSNPRPWSLIGRKGPHSESSSLHQQLLEEVGQEVDRMDEVLSPNMLPTLFTALSAGSKSSIPPLSPISLGGGADGDTGGFPPMVMPPTPPPEGDLVHEISASERVMDFTGQVTLEGRSAVAGGGYSDVWRGILNSSKNGRGQELKVAVKVIRSHQYGDVESEDILKRRLARELDVWKQLKHPNILPLYGTVSGFGRYDSLVCPWMENGSVSRYMEKWGDIMSMTDRLQVLCEVAEGLRYLHSHGIVHGDLTGSNILIDDNRRACLCDFGLSNIVTEFQGVFSSHSTISGAIRWADATLFTNQAAQVESDDLDEPPMPMLDG